MAQDQDLKNKNLLIRIYRSIFPGHLNPKSEKERRRAVLNSLILHIHPPIVEKSTLKISRTWGLGGMALVLIINQFVSGVFLKFIYLPFPGKAYDSILVMQKEVLFGQLVRNIHYWSSVALIIITFLHLLRVYFTGAFTRDRQFNWIIGLSLLFLVIFSNFTGYLLPWDQLAYWAITISVGIFGYIPVIGPLLQEMIRGGSEVGSATVSIFYTFHTFILPWLLVLTMAFHFWRVRKAGGVMRPASPGDEELKEKVSTIPNLVIREAVVALVLISVILLMAVFFNAPLGAKANPGLSPNPTKAPWYFMGIQELLLHFHPLFAVLVIPMFLVLALFFIPYIRYQEEPTGNWFFSKKGRKIGVYAGVLALLLTPSLVLLDEYLLKLELWLPDVPTVLTLGLLPMSVLIVGLTLIYKGLKKRFESSNNESIQALFIFLLVAFIIITVIGIFFRGKGMAMVLPWG